MRGLGSTIALVVVLAGLGAYIYWGMPDETAGTASTQEKLFQVEAGQVQELRIKSDSGEVTTLVKENDRWKVTSPITAPASDADASGVVSALGQIEIVRVVDEKPANLADYGLAEPRIEVGYKAGDKSGRLLIGSKTPMSDNLYAKRNDDPRVLLIAAYQEAALNKNTFDLRDKSIIKIERDKIDRIQVARAGGKPFELRKDGMDWKLASPVAARADGSTVESLISRVETAQMKSVVTEQATPADLKKFGLDNPQVAVTLNLGSASARFLVGGKADDSSVYVKDAGSNTVLTADSAIAEDLGKAAEDYRRHEVFEMRAFNATRAEFIRGGQSVIFELVKGQGENAPETWKRVSPNAADVDRAKIDALLAGLADIRATSFTDSTAGTGLNAPVLTVAVKFDNGKRDERVVFGTSGTDAFASLPAGEPGAAKIEREKLDEALKQLDELSK